MKKLLLALGFWAVSTTSYAGLIQLSVSNTDESLTLQFQTDSPPAPPPDDPSASIVHYANNGRPDADSNFVTGGFSATGITTSQDLVRLGTGLVWVQNQEASLGGLELAFINLTFRQNPLRGVSRGTLDQDYLDLNDPFWEGGGTFYTGGTIYGITSYAFSILTDPDLGTDGGLNR